MATYIVQLESNIYNMSHYYGERTITAETLEQAREQAQAIVVTLPERDNVAIKSIKTTDELIDQHHAEVSKLVQGIRMGSDRELTARLINYQYAAIARLEDVAA